MRDAQPPQCRPRARSRRSRSSASKRARSRGEDVSTSIRSPRLGVDQREPPDGGQRALARVVDLDRDHGVARAQSAASGRAQPSWSRKSDTTATRLGRRASAVSARERDGERLAGRGRRRRRRRRRSRSRTAASPGRAPRGGSTIGSPAPNAIDADAAGAAHREPGEHERDALGDVGLEPRRRAERHRRRDVKGDPRRQRPLGHVQAHVRLAGARGRRGVEVADVVARLVRPQLRQLGAGADTGGAAVAGQAVRDEPHQRDVDRVQQRARDRARSLAALPAAAGRGSGITPARRASDARSRARRPRPAAARSRSSVVSPSLSAW